MRSSLGIVAVFALAVAGAFALALAQRAYAPPSTDDSAVSASTRDLYVIDEVDGPFGYAKDLPLGESQYLTVKGLVVGSDGDSAVEHIFRITPDGGSITVNRGMQPGESYSIHVSLNNSSAVPQSAELRMEAPQSMTIEVRSSPGSAAAPRRRGQQLHPHSPPRLLAAFPLAWHRLPLQLSLALATARRWRHRCGIHRRPS